MWTAILDCRDVKRWEETGSHLSPERLTRKSDESLRAIHKYEEFGFLNPYSQLHLMNIVYNACLKLFYALDNNEIKNWGSYRMILWAITIIHSF